ncbi:hypothetical protein BDF19DRAFT_105342 [Syncephalis fuscata]|nr:hypothetical protein BDF19DRAFT_105342 [Syncephalis fuscata]
MSVKMESIFNPFKAIHRHINTMNEFYHQHIMRLLQHIDNNIALPKTTINQQHNNLEYESILKQAINSTVTRKEHIVIKNSLHQKYHTTVYNKQKQHNSKYKSHSSAYYQHSPYFLIDQNLHHKPDYKLLKVNTSFRSRSPVNKPGQPNEHKPSWSTSAVLRGPKPFCLTVGNTCIANNSTKGPADILTVQPTLPMAKSGLARFAYQGSITRTNASCLANWHTINVNN